MRNFASSKVSLPCWLVQLLFVPPLEALGSMERILQPSLQSQTTVPSHSVVEATQQVHSEQLERVVPERGFQQRVTMEPAKPEAHLDVDSSQLV